jgi:hypothetical protein
VQHFGAGQTCWSLGRSTEGTAFRRGVGERLSRWKRCRAALRRGATQPSRRRCFVVVRRYGAGETVLRCRRVRVGGARQRRRFGAGEVMVPRSCAATVLRCWRGEVPRWSSRGCFGALRVAARGARRLAFRRQRIGSRCAGGRCFGVGRSERWCRSVMLRCRRSILSASASHGWESQVADATLLRQQRECGTASGFFGTYQRHEGNGVGDGVRPNEGNKALKGATP